MTLFSNYLFAQYKKRKRKPIKNLLRKWHTVKKEGQNGSLERAILWSNKSNIDICDEHNTVPS